MATSNPGDSAQLNSVDHYVGRYENYVNTRPEPLIDTELAAKELDFKLRVANEYCWSVHKETLTTKSSFFRNAIEQFEGTADDAVTLHDVKPELVVRMMLWAHFGQYPIGVDSYCTHEAKTVNQTLEQGRVDRSQSFTPLWSGIEQDGIMHLGMMVLGGRLGMQKLERFARVQLKKAIQFGGRDAFWKAVESRDGVTQEAARRAEDFRGV